MTYIKAIALRAFRYSEDGINAIHVSDHETFDCPEKLFDGLNDARYVRRAEIGDGHVSLHTAITSEKVNGLTLKAQDSPAQAQDDAPGADHATGDNAAPELAVGPVGHIPAPQPAIKTADLTEAEQAAIDDGSWKAMKFFAKRSIAAKLSDQPIRNGDDADAAIEAYIASKG